MSNVDAKTFLKVVGKERPCRNCFQSGRDMQKCSRCKQIFYCSKECQVADWKRHKKDCSRLQELKQERRERLGVTESKIREKWLDRVALLLPVVAFQSLSEEEFDQQPPAVEVVITVAFHYNYGTYMPVRPPKVFSLSQVLGDNFTRDDLQAQFEQLHTKRKNSKVRTHYIHVVFENDVVNFLCSIDPDVVAATGRDLGLTTSEYSHEESCRVFQEIELPKYLYNFVSYKDAFEFNLQQQFNFFQAATISTNVPWIRFVINAFRYNERQSLKGTHVVICYFLFDHQLGKMKRFTRYRLVTMEEAKQMVPESVRRLYLCLDQPRGLPVLLVEEYSKDLYAVTPDVTPPPTGFQYWNEEQSREAAELFFNQLKCLEFPTGGLQPSPMIGL